MTVPTHIVALDFETRWRTDLSVDDLGTDTYASHPDGKVFLVGLSSPDGRLDQCVPPEEVPWRELDGVPLAVANANFETAWLRRLELDRVIPGDVRIGPVYDALALSRYLQGPASLAAASAFWLGVEHSKAVRTGMKGQEYADLDPELKAEWQQYCLRDARITLVLVQFLLRYVPASECSLVRQSVDLGLHGIQIDMDYLGEATLAAAKAVKDATAKLPWVATGAKAGSYAAMREELTRLGFTPPPNFNRKSPEWRKWWTAQDIAALPEWLSEENELTKATKMLSLVTHIGARVRARDGRVPFSLMPFAAAATLRWGGREQINVQTLPKAVQAGVQARRLFIAKPGYKFVCSDLSQIEPRVQAHLVGDDRLISYLAGGMDLYESFGRSSGFYDGPSPLAKHNPELRQTFKAQVLSLGFGTGAQRFMERAHLGGKAMTFEEAKTLVDEYRKANPQVTSRWRALERQFVLCVVRKKDRYVMPLPSGRLVTYWHPRQESFVSEDEDGVRYQYVADLAGKRVGLYGSKLHEHSVQGTARDVFVSKLLLLEELGRTPLFHSHDEVVYEVPEADAEGVAETVRAVFSQQVPWLPGLPLGASVSISDYYSKT